MLSIIIPTLNEEDYLPLLLESIKKQNVKDYEIIVADAGSEDKTLEIAKRYGCKIVAGGLPAKGRNNGAKYANGDILLFLDADTILPDNFLTKSFQEFNIRELDIASFCLHPYPERKFNYLLINIFYNKFIILSEKFFPHSAVGILIKKGFFDKLKGYDEDIKLAEDHDLSRRAVRHGKFGIIRSMELFISDRRFKKDGWLATGIIYLLCELHTIFIGPVKSDIFNYKFNHYKDKEK